MVDDWVCEYACNMLTELVTNLDIIFYTEPGDVKLVDDGNGAYIKEWNLDIAQPTDAQLDTYEDSANTQEALDTVRSNRQAEYPDIGDQLDDLFKAGAFSDEMTATLQAVKDKYPKE